MTHVAQFPIYSTIFHTPLTLLIVSIVLSTKVPILPTFIYNMDHPNETFDESLEFAGEADLTPTPTILSYTHQHAGMGTINTLAMCYRYLHVR